MMLCMTMTNYMFLCQVLMAIEPLHSESLYGRILMILEQGFYFSMDPETQSMWCKLLTTLLIAVFIVHLLMSFAVVKSCFKFVMPRRGACHGRRDTE